MATTRCPACGLTVPYFCCEGLVCPACGYDEAQDVPPHQEVMPDSPSQRCPEHPLLTDLGASQSPVE
jgi:hypothetical protein